MTYNVFGGTLSLTQSINHRLHRPCAHTDTCVLLLFFMPWCFIPRVLRLADVKIYVRNGHDGDSKTVNVLARHTALKRWIAAEIRWYRNVVSRSSVQSAALSVDFCKKAVRLVRQGTKSRWHWMTLNVVMALFCVISPKSVAIVANYVKVVD